MGDADAGTGDAGTGAAGTSVAGTSDAGTGVAGTSVAGTGVAGTSVAEGLSKSPSLIFNERECPWEAVHLAVYCKREAGLPPEDTCQVLKYQWKDHPHIQAMTHRNVDQLQRWFANPENAEAYRPMNQGMDGNELIKIITRGLYPKKPTRRSLPPRDLSLNSYLKPTERGHHAPSSSSKSKPAGQASKVQTKPPPIGDGQKPDSQAKIQELPRAFPQRAGNSPVPLAKHQGQDKEIFNRSEQRKFTVKEIWGVNQPSGVGEQSQGPSKEAQRPSLPSIASLTRPVSLAELGQHKRDHINPIPARHIHETWSSSRPIQANQSCSYTPERLPPHSKSYSPLDLPAGVFIPESYCLRKPSSQGRARVSSDSPIDLHRPFQSLKMSTEPSYTAAHGERQNQAPGERAYANSQSRHTVMYSTNHSPSSATMAEDMHNGGSRAPFATSGSDTVSGQKRDHGMLSDEDVTFDLHALPRDAIRDVVFAMEMMNINSGQVCAILEHKYGHHLQQLREVTEAQVFQILKFGIKNNVEVSKHDRWAKEALANELGNYLKATGEQQDERREAKRHRN